MSDSQFGGRLVLRDGQGEADLVIDIDTERVSLMQGDRLLGEYPLRDVGLVRMDKYRIWLSFAGEVAYFYPMRSDEFVKAYRRARQR